MVPYYTELGRHKARVCYKESPWSPSYVGRLLYQAKAFPCLIIVVILVKYKKVRVVVVNSGDTITAIKFSVDLHPATNPLVQGESSHLRLFFLKIFLCESVIATPCVVDFLGALDEVFDFVFLGTVPRFVRVALSVGLAEEETNSVLMEAFETLLVVVNAKYRAGNCSDEC